MHAPAKDSHWFNSGHVEALIEEYRETDNLDVLSDILAQCELITLWHIRSKATIQHEELCELVQVCSVKIMRSIKAYDPDKASAFTWIDRLIRNMLATTVTRKKTRAARYPDFESAPVYYCQDSHDINDQFALDDACWHIRTLKTSCTDPVELSCQRWFTADFIKGGFECRRHVAARAAEIAFGVSHRRSRFLYDSVILEVRRVMFDWVNHPLVDVNALRGTRELPLLQYREFMSPKEFGRFVILLKDLAPYLVVQIKPENAKAIERGDKGAIRENVSLILNGCPWSTYLFAQE